MFPQTGFSHRTEPSSRSPAVAAGDGIKPCQSCKSFKSFHSLLDFSSSLLCNILTTNCPQTCFSRRTARGTLSLLSPPSTLTHWSPQPPHHLHLPHSPLSPPKKSLSTVPKDRSLEAGKIRGRSRCVAVLGLFAPAGLGSTLPGLPAPQPYETHHPVLPTYLPDGNRRPVFLEMGGSGNSYLPLTSD